MRDIKFEFDYIDREGSVVVTFGKTKVICSATVQVGVPKFLRKSGTGWLNAEYGMLPCSTSDRIQRESIKGKQQGRTIEIQRLIGRSLRKSLDLSLLRENTIVIDCDVIQADGGTRTASITGGYVALELAIRDAMKRGILDIDPIVRQVAAISVGLVDGEIVVDMNYREDSNSDMDLNIVMDSDGNYVEIQGSSERLTITPSQFNSMLSSGREALLEVMKLQKEALSKSL